MTFWEELALAAPIIAGIGVIKSEIDAGQQAESPPITTYVDGKHGQFTLVWTPLPAPGANDIPVPAEPKSSSL